MRISTEQAAAEQHVYDQLEARDGDTVDAFADHCENWLGSEHTLPLLRAVIATDDAAWHRLMARIASDAPALHAALAGIVSHFEKHRAEFIEEEAQNLTRRDAA